MKDFRGKTAVITGAGSGMGRELALQLSVAGCHVALADLSAETMAETAARCEATGSGTRVSVHVCDVSDEASVLAFRDEVMDAHDSDHVHLLFNNAGIGGGGSFVKDRRADWERTFGVCWFGVYNCARAFLPLLIAADEAHMVNTSSVNGFWASLGPEVSHTAYSAAKFAVKGFSEALITDLRLNAPHVRVSVVMPGHIGTNIAINSGKVLGKTDPMNLSPDEVARVRESMVRRGFPVDNQPDDHIRAMLKQRNLDFRERAPTSAAQAARVILQAVRDEQWRVLIGEDAHALDAAVRASPESAYDDAFIDEITSAGHLRGVVSRAAP